jgi:metallo-beta-lactamase family protein
MKVLIDCGLFQGFKNLRRRNWEPFPVPPESIDVILITHAHLDHSGYVPAIVKSGFKGKIHMTAGTFELCKILWADSAKIFEEDTERANRKGYTKHQPAKTLFSLEDVERALSRVQVVEFNKEIQLKNNLTAKFIHAGHILGASQILLTVGSKTIHFTGDLGRQRDHLMMSPQDFPGADILVCESTYGDSLHSMEDPEDQLQEILSKVIDRGGTAVIPAFAVGRTQSLMLHIWRLIQKGRIPNVPVYLNSPMATSVSSHYHQHQEEHRIDASEFEQMYKSVRIVRDVEQSKALNENEEPKIIIAASGMMTGGRILHHVAKFGTSSKNAILFSGYQPGGTRGRLLLEGAKSIRIFKKDVPIHAEMYSLDSLSAHMDSSEILNWLKTSTKIPSITYLTHGEPAAADRLRFLISDQLGWQVKVATYSDVVDIDNPR